MGNQKSDPPMLKERRVAVFTLLVASFGAGFVAAHLVGGLVGAAAMFTMLLFPPFRGPVLRLWTC